MHHPLTMTHTNQEQVNDGWTVNKKRRRGVQEDGDYIERVEECWKFGINFGELPYRGGGTSRTTPKIPLYYWVKVQRRLTRTGNALLVPKDNRSQKRLMEVNSTSHNQQCTNGRKYQTTNSKELSAEQEVGTGKGGNRPTTIHQWMDKAICTINEGISGSYVSEPDKTEIFRTIGQSIPTKQQATNTTPAKQGRTNRRCTGNNKHCTNRGNIPTKEDFNRNHSPSTYTQENNGGSHGRYQHTQRIDDNVVHNNGSHQINWHSSCRGGKVVSKTGLSQGQQIFLSDMHEHDGVVPNIGP